MRSVLPAVELIKKHNAIGKDEKASMLVLQLLLQQSRHSSALGGNTDTETASNDEQSYSLSVLHQYSDHIDMNPVCKRPQRQGHLFCFTVFVLFLLVFLPEVITKYYEQQSIIIVASNMFLYVARRKKSRQFLCRCNRSACEVSNYWQRWQNFVKSRTLLYGSPYQSQVQFNADACLN